MVCSFTDDAIEAGVRKSLSEKVNRDDEEDKLDKDKLNDENDAERQSPETYSSFVSSIFFSWFTKVVWMGRHGGLTTENLYNLEDDIRIDNILNEFSVTYKKEMDKLKKGNATKKPVFSALKLLKVFIKQYGFYFLGGSLAKLVHDLFQFVSPLLLESLIIFIKDKTQFQWHGAFLVILMMFVGV